MHLPRKTLELLLTAGTLTLAACSSPQASSDDQAANLTNASSPRAFCSAPSVTTSSTDGSVRSSFWNADDVQRGIREVLKSPSFGCTPHSGYVAAYAAMTKERDTARCTKDSPMSPPSELDARINDALADMMTRNYLAVVKACRSGTPPSSSADIEASLCAMHERAEKENWSALRVALGSTGYYLSTHIAAALSAIAHLDDVWAGTEFVDLDSRVKRLRDYKPTYDAFNEFLGRSLSTVASALEHSGLTPNSCAASLFHTACSFGDFMRTPKLVFGNRRDVSFDLAMTMAARIRPGEHPWTARGADGHTHMRADIVHAPAFPEDPELAKTLSDLAAEGRQLEAALANPLMQAFGGHTFESLKDEDSHKACAALMAEY